MRYRNEPQMINFVMSCMKEIQHCLYFIPLMLRRVYACFAFQTVYATQEFQNFPISLHEHLRGL